MAERNFLKLEANFSDTLSTGKVESLVMMNLDSLRIEGTKSVESVKNVLLMMDSRFIRQKNGPPCPTLII